MKKLSELYIMARNPVAQRFISADKYEQSIANQRSWNPPQLGLHVGITSYETHVYSTLLTNARTPELVRKIVDSGFDTNRTIKISKDGHFVSHLEYAIWGLKNYEYATVFSSI